MSPAHPSFAPGGRLALAARSDSPAGSRPQRAEIDERLSVYLRRCAGEAFRWGQRDCALFVADWVRSVTGIDAAWDLRGLYGSRIEAARLIGDEDLLAVVGRCAARAGLVPTVDPQAGDIAVLDAAGFLDGGAGQACAIRTRRGWVMRTARGLVCTDGLRTMQTWTTLSAAARGESGGC